jgi:hypothetical protein
VDGFVEALEAAFDLGDDTVVDELLAFAENRPKGEVLGYFHAQRLRFEARRSAARGADDEAVTAFEAAVDRFLDTGHVYWQAVTRLETAEHHVARGRPRVAELLLAQAREVFESIGARPALERVAALERQNRPERRRHRRLTSRPRVHPCRPPGPGRQQAGTVARGTDTGRLAVLRSLLLVTVAVMGAATLSPTGAEADATYR